jgi:hypothetical protein
MLTGTLISRLLEHRTTKIMLSDRPVNGDGKNFVSCTSKCVRGLLESICGIVRLTRSIKISRLFTYKNVCLNNSEFPKTEMSD